MNTIQSFTEELEGARMRYNDNLYQIIIPLIDNLIEIAPSEDQRINYENVRDMTSEVFAKASKEVTYVSLQDLLFLSFITD